MSTPSVSPSPPLPSAAIITVQSQIQRSLAELTAVRRSLEEQKTKIEVQLSEVKSSLDQTDAQIQTLEATLKFFPSSG